MLTEEEIVELARLLEKVRAMSYEKRALLYISQQYEDGWVMSLEGSDLSLRSCPKAGWGETEQGSIGAEEAVRAFVASAGEH
jgi:hypothetical protein